MNRAALITFVVVVGAVLLLALWLWGGNIGLLTGGTLTPTRTTQVGQRAVSLAMGEVLVFRTPDSHHGAIRFDRMTNDWGVDYSSWYLPANDDESFREVCPYRGHVFEKYWQTRTGAHSVRVKDIGGQYSIECGPIRLEWSASTWVYFPEGYKFAVFPGLSIDEINATDASIEWHTIDDEHPVTATPEEKIAQPAHAADR